MNLQFPDVGYMLQPGHLVAWLLAGLIAGFLASWIVRGRGMGCFGNIVVGLVGAFVGSFLIGLFRINIGPQGFVGTVVVSAIGAAVFLFILNLFRGGRDN